MSITTNASKVSALSGRKMWFVFAIGAALVVAIISFWLMSSVMKKDTYYVLTSDIPARTQITTGMLTELETAAGTQPPTALSIADITDETYSLTSLKAGDIITASNTGALTSLNAGLPSNYVITSFTADPSLAAGGNVKRGDYIDIMMVANDDKVTSTTGYAASYVLQRVLVVDATLNLDSYSAEESADGSEGQASQGAVSDNTADPSLRSGIPTMFTVGVLPEHAATLALAGKYELFVVLSSADTTANNGQLPVPPTVDSPGMWGVSPNAGVDTDNTFGLLGKVEDEAKTREDNTETTAPTATPTDGTVEDNSTTPPTTEAPVE